LAGQDIFDRYLAAQAANWTAGIPQNAVPQDLGPEAAAGGRYRRFSFLSGSSKNRGF
jgi:hypothetical protein